jgi:tetratricopeptide (TPR) repeat protein
VRRSLVLAASALAACGGAGDRERLGDQAYGQARYDEALTEYRAVLGSHPDARVWAKAGAAALRAGDLRQASAAYLRLAVADPTRAEEAAEGLETVARAADQAADSASLGPALAGLREVAPDRMTGHYAVLLAERAGADSADLAVLLPRAMAAAGDPTTVDSLLTLYAAALQATAGCGHALLQFRTILRRTQDGGVRARAKAGAATCAYTLGVRAESAGRTEDAALWFAEAARMDSSTVTGRRSLLRYGEARLTQGDTLVAALAFQAAAPAGGTDSIGEAATARLHALGMTRSSGDSTRTDGR